ncbi:MAG: extracellular solute-binding protein, partial [Lachnospiraceae bacterium]|nr:extracellular solute-binding protein [Lachnospiraceae bacterium]
LAGCGSSSSSSTSSSSTSSSSSERTGTSSSESTESSSAAAEETSSELSLPVSDETIEVTIAVERHTNDATEGFEEKTFVIQAEEATNIHVNWIEISTDISTKLAALLAGDMPDAFIGLLSDSNISQNSGLFANLTDKIETYVPNFINTCEEYDIDWESYMTFPDGNVYSVMGGFYPSPNNQTSGLMWINQQWLDDLGLEYPTTAEDLYNVLVAFRDNNPNGDDSVDVIPFDFCVSHYASRFWNLTSMYGVPGLVKYEDGQAIATLNTDAFYESLCFLHKLVEEGLLNPEGFTQSSDQYISNIDSMKVGVFLGWAPYSYITSDDNIAQYTALAPVAAEGYSACWPTANMITANRNTFTVSASSPYVDELLQWWNYLNADQDMAMLVAYGEEGLLYTKGDDGLYYSNTPTAEQLEEAGYGAYSNNINSSTLQASLGLVNYHPLVHSSLQPVEGTTSYARWEGIKVTQPYYNGFESQRIVPADAQEEFSFATEGLTDYVDNFAATSVMNGVTEEQFETFKQQLEYYGYNEYIQYYQNKIDGTFD